MGISAVSCKFPLKPIQWDLHFKGLFLLKGFVEGPSGRLISFGGFKHMSGWWFGTIFSIYREYLYNHPNWLSYFSEGWLWNHQPVMFYDVLWCEKKHLQIWCETCFCSVRLIALSRSCRWSIIWMMGFSTETRSAPLRAHRAVTTEWAKGCQCRSRCIPHVGHLLHWRWEKSELKCFHVRSIWGVAVAKIGHPWSSHPKIGQFEPLPGTAWRQQKPWHGWAPKQWLSGRPDGGSRFSWWSWGAQCGWMFFGIIMIQLWKLWLDFCWLCWP